MEYSKIGLKLRQNKEQIISIWEKRVMGEIPAANAMDRTAIRNTIPVLFDKMARTLEKEPPKQVADLTSELAIAKEHGEQRAAFREYSLQQVIHEYQILRQVTLDALEKDGQLKPVDRDVILNAISLAERYATREFSSIRKIAERLRLNKERIISIWEKRVVEEVPAAKAMDRAAIRNTIPALFERMIRTLDQEPPKRAANLEMELQVAREHGKQRSQLKAYSLEQIIHEYQILREVLLEVLEEEHALERVDRDVVLDAISLAERYATQEFSNIRLELEKEVCRSQNQVRDLQSEREQRETFVSTLSHDLRNPITSARMNVELLIKNPGEGGALVRHAGRVLDDLSRLDIMIQNLLDANRIRAGEKLALNIDELNLNECIQEVLDGLTAVYGQRFVFNPKEQIHGYWDGSLLHRALENLCTNAIKYGSLNQDITISTDLIQGTQVKIGVHNWGTVIGEKERRSLFEPFQRGSANPSAGPKGWGLGLVLVKGMAEAHGGSVEVASSMEQGTRFSIKIPLDARQLEKRPAA
jgi:signal transduction histidine kinase